MMTNRRKDAPRILVVDDDEDLSQILATGLSENGFHVLVAASAAEALKKLSLQKFECVILDMRMPGGGERVITSIRGEKGFNFDTPILVMSGYLDADVVKRIRAQVSDILVKPFKLPLLVAKINGVLPPANS